MIAILAGAREVPVLKFVFVRFGSILLNKSDNKFEVDRATFFEGQGRSFGGSALRLALVSGSALPFFGGSERLLRGGTHHVHHSVLVVGADRA